MNIRRIIATGVIAALALILLITLALAAFRDRLFDLYVGRLDTWVNAGGNVATLQFQVVETCGKLILTQAAWFERIQLLTFYRSELDFRVDVCAKMTVNRVYKQPEFEKPEMVTKICDDPRPYHDLFQRLCRRSFLRPAQ